MLDEHTLAGVLGRRDSRMRQEEIQNVIRSHQHAGSEGIGSDGADVTL